MMLKKSLRKTVIFTDKENCMKKPEQKEFLIKSIQKHVFEGQKQIN